MKFLYITVFVVQAMWSISIRGEISYKSKATIKSSVLRKTFGKICNISFLSFLFPPIFWNVSWSCSWKIYLPKRSLGIHSTRQQKTKFLLLRKKNMHVSSYVNEYRPPTGVTVIVILTFQQIKKICERSFHKLQTHRSFMKTFFFTAWWSNKTNNMNITFKTYACLWSQI